MARVTKEADVRRDDLLDVALGLCVEVGFESMSVEQVTTKAGVAKGTFYHYFTSKQDLLAQLVARFGDELFEHLEREMTDASGDALERLLKLLRLSTTWKLERLDATLTYLPFLFTDENYTLRYRLYTVWFERLRPLVLSIVEQGVREGTLSVDDPAATTTVLLTLWVDGGNRLWESAIGTADFAGSMLAGAKAISVAQERILGVQEGSLDLMGSIEPDVIDSVRTTLVEQSERSKGPDRTDREELT